MQGNGKTIAKNASVMLVSQLFTWALSFTVAIFLPRYLGAETFGELAVAYSVWSIMSVFLSFGMDVYLTKMVARDPARAATLLMTTFVLRTGLFVIGCGLVMGYLYLLRYPPTIVYITYILGISYLTGLLNGALVATLSGLERMEFVSLSGMAARAVSTGFTLLFIYLGLGVFAIASVNIITSLVSLAIMLYFLTRKISLRPHFRLAEAWAMLRASTVYLMSGLVLVIYQQIDTLFISSLIDSRTVGWYSTALTLNSTLMFVPVVFTTVIFPTLTRSYASAQDSMPHIIRRCIDLMFLLSIPIGLGVVIVAHPLVILIYGPEFAPSGPILAMMGVVLIFTYLITLLGQLLISMDRTNRWTLIMLVATLATVPLDFLLIPWCDRTFGNGALGGAMAFLVTEFGMLVAGLLMLPRNTLQWSSVRTAALSLLAGLTMMAASWWCRETMMPLAILIGAATYVGMVFLLRIIPREDLLLVREAGLQILARLRRGRGAQAGAD